MSAPASAAPFPGARVLIVDDEPEVRESWVRALTLLGYQADGAESAAQALDMVTNIPYDVAVLDIILGPRKKDMDGIELMRQMRREHPRMPIIILTGHASLETAIDSVKLRAEDYLRKPVSLQELDEAIAAALRERAMVETPKDEEDRFLRAGPVTLDRERQIAYVVVGTVDPVGVRLANAEAKLLTALMKQPGVPLSCAGLAAALGHANVSDKEARSLMRPHISRLRSKIEPDRRRDQLILCAPDGSYVFCPGPYE